MHSAEAVITLETEMEHPFPNPPRSAVGTVPVLLVWEEVVPTEMGCTGLKPGGSADPSQLFYRHGERPLKTVFGFRSHSQQHVRKT